jgi:hypothetical protein
MRHIKSFTEEELRYNKFLIPHYKEFCRIKNINPKKPKYK